MAQQEIGQMDVRRNSSGSDVDGAEKKFDDDYPVEKSKDINVLEDGTYSDTTSESSIEGPADKDDILTHTIHVADDPTVQAVTFRSLFLGLGLALFGGTLSTIYYFKPQTILISTPFLAVVTYFLGEFMSLAIPRKGWIGKWLNPFPFNKKEHLAIVIAANSASVSATAIEVLAAEQLYYNNKLTGAVGIFLLFSSQYCGYGMAGMMRKALVYPKNMLWPANLPVASLLETLHFDKKEARGPLKLFVIAFTAIFFWEIVPEWIMPILTGVSIVCLAVQNSDTITNIFGGTSGDEGLGLFSLCFDWQYISGGLSPLFYPFESLVSQGLGICLCIIVFLGTYYNNLWDARKFPFLSQSIFSDTSTADNPVIWNQTFVIGPDKQVDPTKLAIAGLPYFATTYGINVLVTNMAAAAAVTHLFLWNWPDIYGVLQIFAPSNLEKFLRPSTWAFWKTSSVHDPDQEHYDPHYKLIMAYKPAPDWWYLIVFICSFVIAMVVIYEADSTLPWWGLIVAILNGFVYLLIFGCMVAISGVPWLVQQSVQMIGGYIQPGDPVANMYYSLYGYNALIQGQLMAQDLKLAQYGHLAPRVTFTFQMLGTLVGSIITYVETNNIITNQRTILLSIQGSNIWSGQQVQAFNSLAVTWGGLPHQLFSVGGTYQWFTLIFIPGFFAPLPLYFLHKKYPNVGFNVPLVPVIILYVSWLCVGINSSLMSFFIIGFASQYFWRRRKPDSFVKYNYILSAALDGGTSVSVFIMSFAIFGAAGVQYYFPIYWGNNYNGNFDHCQVTPGAGA